MVTRSPRQGAQVVPEFDYVEPIRPAAQSRPVFVPGLQEKPSQHLDALAGFVSSFGSFVGRKAKEKQAEQEKLEKERGLAKWYQMDRDQQQEALRTGNIPQGLDRVEAEATFGTAEANRWLQTTLPELSREYDTDPALREEFPDKTEYIRQRRNEAAQELAGDQQTVFVTGTEDVLSNKFDPAVAERRREKESAGRVNNSTEALRYVYNRMKDDGRPADEIVAEMHDAINTSTAFKNITGPEANHVLLQLAREAAREGDPDLVIALRDTERVGADGQKIALGDITASRLDGSNFNAEFDKLLRAAEKQKTANDSIEDAGFRDRVKVLADKGELTEKRAKEFLAERGEDRSAHWAQWIGSELERSKVNARKREVAEQYAADNAAGMDGARREVNEAIAEGRLHEIIGDEQIVPPEKPGNKPQIVKNKDVAKELFRAYEERFDERLAGEIERINADPDLSPQHKQKAIEDAQRLTVEDKVNLYSRNRITNDRWKRQLKDVSTEATTALAESGDIPEDVQSAANLYVNLWDTMGAGIENYVDNDSDRVFFEEYRRSLQAERDPQTAVKLAARAVEKQREGAKSFSTVSVNEVDEFLADNADAFQETYWFDEVRPGVSDDEPMVFSDADKAEFKGMAQWALRNLPSVEGDPATAMEWATEWWTRNHANVHGRPVYMGAEGTPPDFKTQAESFLNEFYEEHKDGLARQGVDSATDLILERRGSGVGQWVVYSKQHGIPVSPPAADGLPTGRPVFFDMPTLHEHRIEMRERKDREQFERAQEEQRQRRDRQENPPSTVPDMGEPLDPEGRERDFEPLLDQSSDAGPARDVLKSSFLVDGKETSHVDGMKPEFATRLAAALQDPEMPEGVRIYSGHRDNKHQARLFDAAVKKHGSKSAARKWVAPPGKSRHNHGIAADLSHNGVRLDAVEPQLRQQVHNVMKRHGLEFRMDHEPWHVELSEDLVKVAKEPVKAGEAPDFSDTRDILIRTVIGEAESEGPEGWAAVAHTIMNRTKDPRWSNSPLLVTLQDKQFSIWNDGPTSDHRGAKVSKDSSLYKRVGRVVDEVLEGKRVDPTMGATHYLNPSVLDTIPSWFSEEKKKHKTGKGIRIGDHVFVGSRSDA